MNRVILYASKKGSTKKCAEFLHSQIEDSDLYSFQEFKGTIENYDRVVLCGPVYFGQVHKSLKEFLRKNKEALMSKKTTIVINAMNTEEYDVMLERNFTEDIRLHMHIVYGGGAYYFKRLNVLQGLMVRKISGIKKDYEKILYEELKKIRS